MDQASYVAGFFGVLIGITLTELIKGVAETLRNGKRIKYYVPHGILVGEIFMFIIQSFFDFQWLSRDIHNWTPILLIRFTLPWILICLSSYLVFPSFDGSETINFKDNFDRFFFSGMKVIVGLIPLIISVNIFYIHQSPFHMENLMLMIVFASLIITIIFRREWQKILILWLGAVYELYHILSYWFIIIAEPKVT